MILLDVNMPGMDGLTVCAELARDERTRAIPVILVTARDDHETRVAGMKLGVSEFLTKPVNKTELFAVFAVSSRAARSPVRWTRRFRNRRRNRLQANEPVGSDSFRVSAAVGRTRAT